MREKYIISRQKYSLILTFGFIDDVDMMFVLYVDVWKVWASRQVEKCWNEWNVILLNTWDVDISLMDVTKTHGALLCQCHTAMAKKKSADVTDSLIPPIWQRQRSFYLSASVLWLRSPVSWQLRCCADVCVVWFGSTGAAVAIEWKLMADATEVLSLLWFSGLWTETTT